jgi:hypothetical protein
LLFKFFKYALVISEGINILSFVKETENHYEKKNTTKPNSIQSNSKKGWGLKLLFLGLFVNYVMNNLLKLKFVSPKKENK